MLTLLLVSCAVPSMAAASVQSTAHMGSSSPRVLVVDLDDVGYDLLRATPTPTLDWLENNGRFFTNFTTSPVCSPTRAMFNMGAFPSHPDVLVGKIVRADGTFSMPTAPLEPLAQIVVDAGYTTAKVGKWHLSSVADTTHPNRCGWQDYRGSMSNLGSGTSFGTYFDFTKVVNGVVFEVRDRYATTDETDDALEFLRAGTNLVSLSYHAPHVPLHLPPPHLHSVSPVVEDLDVTRAMLAACDTELARVVRQAILSGYQVMVFGDNGTAEAIGGQKGSLFEGGIVTPFWAYGPGIAPGVDESRIGAQDIYDTVADLFGLPSAAATRGPDSRSFVRPLRGHPQYRRWAYSEKFPNLGVDPRTQPPPWARTLRTDRYKLMRDQGGVSERLFDLINDPGETTDLLSSGPLSPAAQTVYDQLVLILTSL